MNPINTPVAIRLEFVGFDDPAGRGLFGTERAARSLLRRPAGGREAYRGSLKPEAAKVLADLRTRTGRTYSAIIEGLLLAEHAQDLRRAG